LAPKGREFDPSLGRIKIKIPLASFARVWGVFPSPVMRFFLLMKTQGLFPAGLVFFLFRRIFKLGCEPWKIYLGRKYIKLSCKFFHVEDTIGELQGEPKDSILRTEDKKQYNIIFINWLQHGEDYQLHNQVLH